jgi:filamentous hemagglutinin
VGNHTFKTDAQGRVKEVTCDNLQKNTNDRNGYQQSVKCKKVKDGQVDDQGGHLIGSQFNGAGEQINLVPMKKSINQPPGSYAAMEQQWANALNGGGTVTNVRIEIIYGANNRPVQLNVYCKVNGVDKFYPHIN